MIAEVELNPQDQEIFETYKEKSYSGHSKPVSCIAWNPAGSKLASADNNLRVWNFDDGLQRGKDLKCSDATVESL
jgi:WD40 repeat protein